MILKRLAITDRNLGFFDFGEGDGAGKAAETCRAPKKNNASKGFEHNHNNRTRTGHSSMSIPALTCPDANDIKIDTSDYFKFSKQRLESLDKKNHLLHNPSDFSPDQRIHKAHQITNLKSQINNIYSDWPGKARKRKDLADTDKALTHKIQALKNISNKNF